MNYKYPSELTNSKLIFLLKSFSKADIKDFKKLLSSPIFTNGRNYSPLLTAMLKNGSRKRKVMPDKPEKKSIQTYRNRSSELFKLAEDYLVFKSLRKSKIEKNKILLQSYLDNNLFRYFSGKYEKIRKEMDQLPNDETKFQNISAIEQLNVSNIIQSQEFKNIFDPYFKFTTTSSCVYLLNLFEYGVEYIQQEQQHRKHEHNIVQELLRHTNFGEIIDNFYKSEVKLYRMVAMQFYFYKAFENPDMEKNYFTGRRIFEELRTGLSRSFLIRQYKLMTNYCIMRRNQGVKKFELELFKLYNERLKFEIYYEHEEKMFPVSTFRNYVLLGLMLKKYKWTENFIKKYCEELPEDSREDEVRISYSRLFFSNEEYKRSLENLRSVKGNNYLYYSDSSILKLCCYYELEMYEEAFFEIDKFRHFLRNHKEIQKIHKEYFSNFLKIYQSLLKSITNPERKNEFLSKQLQDINLISRRKWLEEKIRLIC